MPTIYDLKPAFQRTLRPLSGYLARLGITANQVTLLALALSVATGAALLLRPDSRWILLLVPLILFLRMALNAIDGMLAREHGMASRLGAVLNELGDVVADAALYLPFAYLPGVHGLWVVLLVVTSIIAEMTGVVAVQIGASRRYDGPLGKSDRAFVFSLIALALAVGIEPGAWLDGLLILASALSATTIINRARHALAERA